MFRSFIFGLFLSVRVFACVPELQPFAWGYNLFVWKNVCSAHSDCEGKVAVGGDAHFEHYSVGARLTSSKDYALVVGGKLSFRFGSVLNGPAIFGEKESLIYVDILHGQKVGQAIDFSEAGRRLKKSSDRLSKLSANGEVLTEGQKIILEGNDPHLNVFLLPAENLAFAHALEIRAPEGSTILINAMGTTAELTHFGFEHPGISYEKILWHFPTVKSLKLQNIGMPGSILALYADVSFRDGVLNGSLVARSFTGNGQLNQHLFQGCIDPVVARAKPEAISLQ